ncbi:MAG TPA: hypothetical protein VNN25_10745 [Thermoanaerobaculia bacterium]|nr:hypothetical protein [Thermoanaerobaculia bacterium]
MRDRATRGVKTPDSDDGKPTTRGKVDRDWFKRTIDLVTLAVVAAGFYLGLDQAKKLTESIESSNRSNNLSTWSTITNQGMEIDKIFVDHPEFQPYFFEGVVIRSKDPNFPRAKAIATAFLDYIDSATALLYQMKKTPTPVPFVEYDTWNHYFEVQFGTSPLLCQTLFESKDIYGQEILKVGLPACRAKKYL